MVLSRVAEEGAESRFFRTFFEDIGKRPIISGEEPTSQRGALTIMPILRTSDASHPDRMRLCELSREYRSGDPNTVVIPLETPSLYRACVAIGLLLGISAKKVRTAYEKATAAMNGNAFDCSALLLISSLEPGS